MATNPERDPRIQKGGAAKYTLYKPKIVPIKPIKVAQYGPAKQVTSQDQVSSGLTKGVATAPALQNGQVDLSSAWIVGSITATYISVTTLSAITANVGNLTVNTGGSISSGETAFATGVGYWLGTDNSGNPQLSIIDSLGNFIIFDGSTANAISISSTGVINVLSSGQVDDGAWSQSAVWNNVSGVPTTLAGYGITDAQSKLPATSVTRGMWFSDNGGPIYAGPEYDTNVNFGFDSPASFTTASSSFVQISDVLGFINPGQAVNIYAVHTCDTIVQTAGSPVKIQIQYSSNGGSTWHNLGPVNVNDDRSINVHTPKTTMGATTIASFTGDLQVRVNGLNASGNSTQFENQQLVVWLYPVSEFYVVTTLSATIPATAAMSCTSVSPTSTCTASINLTVSAQGVSPFTYAWAKVSGTGSITSGSTSRTATISDTETTTTGGATHNTVVNCAVTDSQTYTPSAGSASGGTATLTIGAHDIPAGATVNVSGCTPTAFNGTNLVITSVTSTQIKYALAGTLTMTVFGTVNNVTVTTSNCTITGTFTLTYPPIVANISVSPGSCTTTVCGNNCTANGSATAHPSGGNGSYTYSWSVTAGSATIVSGGSSQTCNFHQTAASSFPSNIQSNTVKCIVADTGGTPSVSPTATLKLTFTCPGT